MERLSALGKRYGAALGVLALGLLLLLWPSGKKTAPAEEPAAWSLATQEERLAETLSHIPGAGRVRVLLAAERSEERVVAQDVREGAASVKLAGSEAIPLRTDYPPYTGAVIIAEGGGSRTELLLLEAVRVFTGLSADKIKVICGGN